jgi:uncharacterized membrane protein
MADEEDAVRLVRDPPTFAHLLDSAFNEIRQSAPDNVAILSRMADRLAMLAALAERPPERRALRRHAEWIGDSAQRRIDNRDDRERVTTPIAALLSSAREAGVAPETGGPAA